MEPFDDPNYSSSIGGGGGGYSSTGTPVVNSGGYPNYPTPSYPTTTTVNYPQYPQTQTSSNLFGSYHNRSRHHNGNQQIDDVRYRSCCTII